MSLEVSFGGTDQTIMAAARSEMPVLSQALAEEIGNHTVILIFCCRLSGVLVDDEIYSVT